MALAELAEWKQYETTYSFEQEPFGGEKYLNGKRRVVKPVLMHVPSAQEKRQKAIARELRKIALQARRPMVESAKALPNRPSVSRWLPISLDVLSLISLSAVISGFFVFLLELSAGRPAFLVPSFSAIFIFTIVGVVSYRLKLAIRRLQSAV